MIHGLDTSFLVSLEHKEHPDYAAARATLAGLLRRGDRLALAPQVLNEFLHVVTDARRLQQPLSMIAARRVARQWWTANEVERTLPSVAAVQQFLDWLDHFRLGRKRLLDTLLAATYHQSGIVSLLTTNPHNFRVFRCFDLITPGGTFPGS